MSINQSSTSSRTGIPLSIILIFPFVFQIFGAVGLVGYLSFKNGQRAVYELMQRLNGEIITQVENHLNFYLSRPHQIGEINVDAIKSGILDIKNFKRSGRFFWKQAQTYTNINLICYYLPSGEGVGAGRWIPNAGVTVVEHSLRDGKDYTYATDSQGSRTKVIDATKYYAPGDDWYVEAVKVRKPKWSHIYTAEGFSNYVTLSAIYPFYDVQDRLLGVMSIDLLLNDISKYLQRLTLSPNTKVFIIERDGTLIGNSSLVPTYEVVNNKTKRLNAFNSSDVVIRDTAKSLIDKYKSFYSLKGQQRLEFILNGQRQFVNVMPWQDRYGLDWLVVVTIPEADFMTQINENSRITSLLCFGAFVAATLLGIMSSRWITLPIQRLNLASQAIAGGDLGQKVKNSAIRELQGLSLSFNQMADQLSGWVNLLERRVEERTFQLAEAKKSAEAAKESAITANQCKSLFLANMSHELRTPLNAIMGYAQIMTRDTSLESKQYSNLQIIRRSGEHLLSLINDVLDMSKIESGQISVYENDFDLFRLLDFVKEVLYERAQYKGLQLVFDCVEGLPQYINSDEKKLRQVLLNLLGNAVKFTESGYVSLQVKPTQPTHNQPEQEEHQLLEFVVEDSGPGIAANELKTLFEPFIQTETGRKTEQGTGLGLSISHKFVDLMGGDLQAESVLGQGSRFKFMIPVKLAAAVPDSKPQQVRRVVGLAKSQPRYRILVVDDRWENRQLLVDLLEPIGFEVKEVSNGKDAVACWEDWRPHLIWMDIRMPGLNGCDATRQIKAQFQGQSTIVIALTASVLSEDVPVIHAAGCDDYVRKPFLEDEIFDKIGQYLNVQYTYETITVDQLEPSETLTLDALAVMPSAWIGLLYQASIQLDVEKITNLLDQIPEEHGALQKSIQAKVDNFDFDQIVATIQQLEKL
jgi:signal transduction histidine kinase/CheY-like chemotaxis protein